MRVLASVLPGTGHLLPLVPTLHALRGAGHTVIVASAEPRVLEDPAYREAARRIAAEIAATPPPASLVPWLASLSGVA